MAWIRSFSRRKAVDGVDAALSSCECVLFETTWSGTPTDEAFTSLLLVDMALTLKGSMVPYAGSDPDGKPRSNYGKTVHVITADATLNIATRTQTE